MIPEQNVQVNIKYLSNSYKQYYSDLGYDITALNPASVDIKHLQPNSNMHTRVICDAIFIEDKK